MMKSFKNYYILSEATLSNDRFNKYYTKVIEKLISGEKVYLGKSKDEKLFIQLDKTKHAKLIDTLKKASTVEEFNAAFKNSNDSVLSKLKWTSLFKGDFSGNSGTGKQSSNKGNEFEYKFAEKIETDPEIQKTIAKCFKVSPDIIKNCEVKLVGEQNNKRPLTFKGNTITCGDVGNNFNIGKLVSDITLVNGSDEYYISCKYGNTVTFVNSGVKKLFPEKWFTGNTPLPKEGQALLDMLGIDADIFKKVFNEYSADKPDKKSKATKDSVDITAELKKNKEFATFMKSVMGYGYLMAHADAKYNVHYIDLLEEAALNKFLSGLNSATILYPTAGSAKRIDVIVDYKHITFKINIRSKDGGIYPTHIMADYTFKH